MVSGSSIQAVTLNFDRSDLFSVVGSRRSIQHELPRISLTIAKLLACGGIPSISITTLNNSTEVVACARRVHYRSTRTVLRTGRLPAVNARSRDSCEWKQKRKFSG